MRSTERDHIAGQAKVFLASLRQHEGSSGMADDLLVFFYRLRDEYRIIRSTSDRFRGPSFSFLHELLYQLESRPDETLLSAEWRTFIEKLLSDIESGRIDVAHQ